MRQWPVEKHWSVLAVALPVAVFFLSRSKLPLYVLPLFGPIAVFTAAGLLRVYDRDAGRLWKWSTVLALSCWTVFVVAKGALPFLPGDRDMKVLYASVLSQVPEFHAERLAVLSKKTLNGLQFYVQRELPHIEAEDEIQAWLKGGGEGERYMILRSGQTNRFEKCVFPARVEFSALTEKWLLARVSGAQ